MQIRYERSSLLLETILISRARTNYTGGRPTERLSRRNLVSSKDRPIAACLCCSFFGVRMVMRFDPGGTSIAGAMRPGLSSLAIL
jgi:hypothetical protein